jgi:hypothetical protein
MKAYLLAQITEMVGFAIRGTIELIVSSYVGPWIFQSSPNRWLDANCFPQWDLLDNDSISDHLDQALVSVVK